MAYIEAHQTLRDHRKILDLSAELDMPEPHVTGHCVYLWLWSIDNAPGGKLSSSERTIERAAGWQGERGAFFQAMLNAGLLERDEGGQVWIHDWFDYAGKLMEFRKETTSHKRDMRRARNDGTLEKVRKRDRDFCRYCGREVDWVDRKTNKGGTYDHVDPSEFVTQDNIVVACRGCATKKDGRTPEEAGMRVIPLNRTVQSDEKSIPKTEKSIPGLNPETETSSSGTEKSISESNLDLTTVPNRIVPNYYDDDEDRARARVKNRQEDDTCQSPALSNIERETQNDACANQPIESQTLYSQIEQRLQQRMSNTGYVLSSWDKQGIGELIQTGVPPDTILMGIDEAFVRYKKKYDGDPGIGSFNYCIGVIKELHALSFQDIAAQPTRASPVQPIGRGGEALRAIRGGGSKSQEQDPRYTAFYKLFPDS